MEQLLSNKNRLPYYSDYLGSFSGIYSRYLPVFILLSTRKIPEWFNEWMKYVCPS